MHACMYTTILVCNFCVRSYVTSMCATWQTVCASNEAESTVLALPIIKFIWFVRTKSFEIRLRPHSNDEIHFVITPKTQNREIGDIAIPVVAQQAVAKQWWHRFRQLPASNICFFSFAKENICEKKTESSQYRLHPAAQHICICASYIYTIYRYAELYLIWILPGSPGVLSRRLGSHSSTSNTVCVLVYTHTHAYVPTSNRSTESTKQLLYPGMATIRHGSLSGKGGGRLLV